MAFRSEIPFQCTFLCNLVYPRNDYVNLIVIFTPNGELLKESLHFRQFLTFQMYAVEIDVIVFLNEFYRIFLLHFYLPILNL